MKPPKSLYKEISNNAPLTLRTTKSGTPTLYSSKTDGALWSLNDFSFEAARYFVDNYLEEFGYTPDEDNPNTWIRGHLSEQKKTLS